MIARRTNPEHAMLAEAATTWAATESIDRKLGEELIAAGRELVAAWHAPGSEKRVVRLLAAIEQLEQLVGRP